jgi:type I restriction enzyme S subunit
VSQLPPGWARARLGDLVSARSGNSKLIKGKLFSERGPDLVPAFSASGQDTWCQQAEYDGDGIVLSAVGARCGKAFLATGRWTAIANTHVIRPAEGVDVRFLWYRLNDERFWVRSGSAQPFVKVKASLETLVMLPPLNEQRRIVAAIEEHLSRLDAADASLAAALKRLIALRRTTRAASIGNGWPTQTFGDITVNFDGRRVPVKASDRAARQGAYPYYGASGVIDYVDDFLFDGDYLLVAEDGANLVTRRKPIAFRAYGRFWVNNHAHVVQTTSGLEQRFLELFINGADLSGLITGTAQPKLTQANLNKIVVPVPPLEEQRRIVAEVEERLSRIDAMRASIERAQRRSKALRAAILERAFRGELVPQDPSDEPAEALLARIRAEKDSTKGH